MKYPSAVNNVTPGTVNAAHKVLGVLPSPPAGTVRARLVKLLPGDFPGEPLGVTGYDVCVAEPLLLRGYSFDAAKAYENSNGVGTFATKFPPFEEHALVVEIYDDANPENRDINKIVLGGGEDQIDEITGADHRDLTQIYNRLGSSTVSMCLLGFEYTDTGVPANDLIGFYPSLQVNGAAITDKFLHHATIELYEVDGVSPIFVGTDTPLYSQLLSAPLGSSAGAVQLTVPSTTGLTAGKILACDNELMTVVTVDSPTLVTVTRASLGTTRVAHSAGAEVWISGADARGIFKVVKTGASDLVFETNYTVKVSITWKGASYISTHQFLFRENDV